MGRIVQETSQGRSHSAEPSGRPVLHADYRPGVDNEYQGDST